MLERLGLLLGAITGAQTDNMTRDDGWRLLSIGRQIDRLDFLCSVLKAAFDEGAVHRQDGFGSCWNCSTARSRSVRGSSAASTSRRCCRSSCSIPTIRARSAGSCRLRGRLTKVERSEGYALSELAETIPDVPRGRCTSSETADGGRHDKLLEALDTTVKAVWELSNRIGERYFSHVREAGRTLW